MKDMALENTGATGVQLDRTRGNTKHWFVVRMNRRRPGGIKRVASDPDLEPFKDRNGRTRMRMVSGTGTPTYVPELLLRRARFEVFLPVKMTWCKVNQYRRERHLVPSPLLIDWMFVGWPSEQNRWKELIDMDVVTAVLGINDQPIRIGEGRVAELMKRWGCGCLTAEQNRFANGRRKWLPGDLATIINGPFDGMSLRVVDMTEKKVRGVVDLLGRETMVECQQDVLARPSDVR